MPGIKNLDREENKKIEQRTALVAALESGDSDQFAQAMTNMADGIQQEILQEANQLMSRGLNDQQVLSQRGMTALTAEENKYYNAVIEGQGFVGVEELVPATVIDRVFEDLSTNHPMLNAINFVNTTGVTQWVMKKGDVNPAWWGKLCDAIKELLDNGFETLNMNLYKLSAFIPVCKAMLELGPVWLDRYVRAVLMEAMAIALEEAIVKGTGADQPIGMIKDLAGAVVEGVYPDKAGTAISDFKPKTLGTEVMAPLTKNGKRAVSNVIMVVNPLDYWSRIFAETTYLTNSGTYVYGVLPIPGTIIQSVSVPTGKMIAGVASDYFMGVGSNRKIEASDEVRFIEDERVYITRMVANGRPKDNASFLVFDISGVGEGEVVTP
ncbi:phage major capsid protein [Jeotgalibacillus haloalkalitolerans]|uniref:Phage major capsid protein n=1 Tax=Jeotgalibacillus haloalkalitolerans TaxID=3104292 RepID=A0ABU5KNJ0_9BACL|nr:phage major capsid protein [Jeotgalibacillus sp. HH7-29]MDZ5712245.1 phage major capsid protein [Jeotgalibacillus sp. HH7-29]